MGRSFSFLSIDLMRLNVGNISVLSVDIMRQKLGQFLCSIREHNGEKSGQFLCYYPLSQNSKMQTCSLILSVCLSVCLCLSLFLSLLSLSLSLSYPLPLSVVHLPLSCSNTRSLTVYIDLRLGCKTWAISFLFTASIGANFNPFPPLGHHVTS